MVILRSFQRNLQQKKHKSAIESQMLPMVRSSLHTIVCVWPRYVGDLGGTRPQPSATQLVGLHMLHLQNKLVQMVITAAQEYCSCCCHWAGKHFTCSTKAGVDENIYVITRCCHDGCWILAKAAAVDNYLFLGSKSLLYFTIIQYLTVSSTLQYLG